MFEKTVFVVVRQCPARRFPSLDRAFFRAKKASSQRALRFPTGVGKPTERDRLTAIITGTKLF